MGSTQSVAHVAPHVSPIDAHIGGFVCEARRSVLMPEVELASRLKVSVTTLLAWECGAERIPADCLLAITDHLPCSLDDLFNGLTDGANQDLGGVVF